AVYATAAARIGKYKEVADALYRDQAKWANSDLVWESVAAILNPEERRRVQMLAKDRDVDAEVQRDIDFAATNGFVYIPTILVTHHGRTYPIKGIPDPALFRHLLDLLSSN